MAFFKDGPDGLALKPSAIRPEQASGSEHRLQDKFSAPRLATAFCAIASVEFLALALISLLCAAAYQYAAYPDIGFIEKYTAVAIFIGATEVSISALLGQFSHVQKQRRDRFLWSGLLSVILTFLLLIAFLFVFKLTDHYSRGILMLQLVGICVVSLAVRSSIFSRFQAAVTKRQIPGRRMIVIGDENHRGQYVERLRILNDNVQIVCRKIPDDVGCKDQSQLAIAGFVEQCRALQADDIVILADKNDHAALNSLVSSFLELPAMIYVVPQFADVYTNSRLVELGSISAFAVSTPPLSALDRVIKRIFDICFAAIALILLSPLMLLAAIAVMLDSKGPIFFEQIRHGYNNKPIRVLKFRTMLANPETEFRQATSDDPRITRIGRIFRITGIDELPQLVNILRGDMSVVGPRPHAIPHNRMFIPHIRNFSRRHNVKPGLTGWAQVNGLRGETDTLEKMQRRVEYDLYYIDNWSLLFDLKIILLTIFSGKTYINAG
jgi:Undecaprenyl-phosphate glucose phosphotransferase